MEPRLASPRSPVRADGEGNSGSDGCVCVPYYTRQFIDSMSPTNFAATNPEVLKATIESKGENLLEGVEHMLQDLDRNKGNFRSQDDQDPRTLPHRREYRGDAGQGHLPERDDAAAAIHSVDRDGAPAAAADCAAMDQPAYAALFRRAYGMRPNSRISRAACFQSFPGDPIFCPFIPSEPADLLQVPDLALLRACGACARA